MTSRCAAVCLVVAMATSVGCDSSEEIEAASSESGTDAADPRVSCPESCCCPDIFDGAVARGPCPAGFIFYCDECPFQTACQSRRDATPPAERSETEAEAAADVDADAESSADDADGGR